MNEKDEKIKAKFKSFLSNTSTLYSEQQEFTAWGLRFASGRQWEDGVIERRSNDNRPSVTNNWVRPYGNRIINPIRKNPLRPKIKLADKELTEIIQGKINDIDVNSRSKEAVECAMESQVFGGMGFIRVSTDYIDNENLEQKICIDKVDNPAQCWLGAHQEIDGSDAREGAFMSYITKDMAIEKWGEEVAKASSYDLDIYGAWAVPSGSIADATYYHIKEKSHWRYFFEDGSFFDEIPDNVEKEEFLAYVTNKRRVSENVVECHRFVGNAIVEHTTLPIEYIPIIPVYGDRLYLEDTDNRKWGGISYWLKDSQQAYNYYKSNELELVSKAPKSPWLVAEGQLEGYEDDWDNANTSSVPYLTYKPTSLLQQPVSPPFRADNQAQTQGLMQSAMAISQDMGSLIGVTLGMMGEMQGANESGVSVFQRNTMGELSTIQYPDNVEQSMTQVYRIVLQLMPYVHDTLQRHAIRDERGNRTFVELNLSELLTKEVLKDAEIGIIGGSMRESKRRADAQAVLELSQMFPEKTAEALDLYVGMLDLENGDEFIKRFGGGENAPDPMAMQALQQAQATMDEQEKIMEQMQNENQMLRNALIDQNAKYQNDLKIKMMDSQTKLAVEEIKQEGENSRQDQEIAQEARKNILEIVKDEFAEKNAILKESVTLSDNKGIPNVISRATPEFEEREDRIEIEND